MYLPQPTKQSKLSHEQRELLLNYGGLMGDKFWGKKFKVSRTTIESFRRKYGVKSESGLNNSLSGSISFYDGWGVAHFPHQFKNKKQLLEIIKKHQKVSYITYYQVTFNI